MTMPGMKPAANDEPEKPLLTVTVPVESAEFAPMAAGAAVGVAEAIALVPALVVGGVVGDDVAPTELFGVAVSEVDALLATGDEAVNIWHAPF